ncbi:MAG: hypothetical protein K2N17_03915, partial [Clostridia bacterium]|nr:hypothetical protein [Clostridia bacterium]
REQVSKYFYMPAYDKTMEYLETLTPDNPEVSFEYKRADGDLLTVYKIQLLGVYNDDRSSLKNVIGKLSTTTREIQAS